MKTNTSFPPSEFTANDACPECGEHFASGHDADCSKIHGKWGARSPQDQALLDRMPQANDSGPSLGKQLPGGHNLTVYSPHHADPVDEHQTRPGSNEVGPMLERGVVPGAGSDQHEWVHTHHGEPVNGGFENSGPEAMAAAEKSHKDLTQGFDMRELTGRRRRSGIPRDCPACDDQAFATAHENRYDEGRTNHKMTHDQAIEYADKHAQSDIPYVLEDMNCPHGRLSRRKQAWMGWGPDLIEDTHHKVAGFEWDNHLNGFVSNVANPRIFECSCGAKHPVPSYANCKCGKIWNSYVIGTGGDRHEAAAERFIAREVPVRENVIVANRQLAKEEWKTPPGGVDRGREMMERTRAINQAENWDPEADEFDPRKWLARAAGVEGQDPESLSYRDHGHSTKADEWGTGWGNLPESLVRNRLKNTEDYRVPEHLLPTRDRMSSFDPQVYLHAAAGNTDLSFPSRSYALDDEVEDASPFPSDHHPKAGEATMRQPADDWHSRRQDGKWAPGGHQPKFRKSDS